MKRYINYLKYLLKHKYYVMLECFKIGLYKKGLLHDNSKFRLDEFIPYAKFFYNADGSNKQRIEKSGYYKPTETGDPKFDYAWFLHQKRQNHHWQFWCIPQEDRTLKLVEIPEDIVQEMVCDWKGAGRVCNSNGVIEWYRANSNKLQLHPNSRRRIEEIIFNKVIWERK